MTVAERNRLIKKILTAKYGKGKVTVRGSTGTAYGWVTVRIDFAPKNIDDRRDHETAIWKLFDENKIEIGTYGYDSPGSDYGHGRKIHLDFDPVLDRLDPWTWSLAV